MPTGLVMSARPQGKHASGRGMSCVPSRCFTKERWIVSCTQDLAWFHGSVLAGLVLLACFSVLPVLNSATYAVWNPALLIVLVWGVVFDGTHVWATYSRTYFADDAMSCTGMPGPSSFLWLAVGPAVAVIDNLFFAQDVSLLGHAGLLFRYFLVFAFLWAYWHLIRQHYGLMRLYARRAGEPVGHLDTAVLWLGSLYPYLRFSLSDAYMATNLPNLVPVAWYPAARLTLDVAFAAGLAVLFIAWLARQRRRPTVFGPKHVLIAVVVGFNMLVFATLNNLLCITATLTIFHNLQYHRIVWLYERGHNRVPMGMVPLYFGLGLFFGLLWYAPRILGTAMVPSDLWRNILLGFGWGVAFHHYSVDARIWRIRRTPGLTQALDAGAH
jgi:hypothetical protein